MSILMLGTAPIPPEMDVDEVRWWKRLGPIVNGRVEVLESSAPAWRLTVEAVARLMRTSPAEVSESGLDPVTAQLLAAFGLRLSDLKGNGDE